MKSRIVAKKRVANYSYGDTLTTSYINYLTYGGTIAGKLAKTEFGYIFTAYSN